LGPGVGAGVGVIEKSERSIGFRVKIGLNGGGVEDVDVVHGVARVVLLQVVSTYRFGILSG
jgi:hypothetical protein